MQDVSGTQTGRRHHGELGGTEYEIRVLTIPAQAHRDDTREFLTQAAEYGRWELARSRWYVGGERKVWLRRRIIRVRSTL